MKKIDVQDLLHKENNDTRVQMLQLKWYRRFMQWRQTIQTFCSNWWNNTGKTNFTIKSWNEGGNTKFELIEMTCAMSKSDGMFCVNYPTHNSNIWGVNWQSKDEMVLIIYVKGIFGTRHWISLNNIINNILTFSFGIFYIV